MSLLTKDLIEKCKKYPLYSQDGKGGDATVIARFYISKKFCRDGAFNWIITEGDVIYTDGKPTDIEMFGYACLNGDIQNSELGYIMLSELEEINNSHNLPLVKRDMRFDENINLRDALQKTLRYVPEFLQEPVKYEIYQLKDTEENRLLRFESISGLKNGISDIKGANYYQVFSDKYENSIDMTDASEKYYALDNLYRNLNEDEKPLGYVGHSLSVSDIIVLKKGDNEQAYYINNVGFAELPSSIINELHNERSEYLAVQLAEFMKDNDTYEYEDCRELDETDADVIDNLRVKLNDMSFCEGAMKSLADYMSEASLDYIKLSQGDKTEEDMREYSMKANSITYLENMLNEHMENIEKEQEIDIEKE